MAALIEQSQLVESCSTASNCTESDEEDRSSFEQTQGQLMQCRGDLKSTKPFFRAEALDLRSTKPRKHRSSSLASLPVCARPETKSALPDSTGEVSTLDATLELTRLPLWRSGTLAAPRHAGVQARLLPLGGTLAAGCGLRAVQAGRAAERGRSDAGPRRKAPLEHPTMAMAGGGFKAAAGCRRTRHLDAPVGLSVMSLQSSSPSEASTRSSSRASSRPSSRASSCTSSQPSRR